MLVYLMKRRVMGKCFKLARVYFPLIDSECSDADLKEAVVLFVNQPTFPEME